MKESKLYVEGGGNSSDLITSCRKGFHKLLESSGLRGRLPRIVACGSRNDAYDSFVTELKSNPSGYIGLLVDSEDPIGDLEKPWEHLKQCDGWDRPDGARDEQALLMTTCMETWIIADRETLKEHYGHKLRESKLPSTFELEKRSRSQIQDALRTATKDCSNAYAKNKRSFEVLGILKKDALEQLPSFNRVIRILEKEL